MYFTYLRAKQYDLAAIAELSEDVIQSESVVPIIEPVGAIKPNQFKKIAEVNLPFVLVINPVVGDLASTKANPQIITPLVKGVYKGYKNYALGFTIQSKTTLDEVKQFIASFPNNKHAFIHFHSFKDANALAKIVAQDKQNKYNIFIDGLVGVAYVNQFNSSPAIDILINDGFKKRRRNEDYPAEDFFFDLHRLYKKEYNYDGFGDFTIIGAQHDTGGGPAYVVAIHLTDEDDEGDLVVRHFKSDSLTPPSPADPGGKFSQALERLKTHLDVSPHLDTSGTKEFEDLYDSEHYPGLGMVKKISIKHHIEYVYTFL